MDALVVRSKLSFLYSTEDTTRYPVDGYETTHTGQLQAWLKKSVISFFSKSKGPSDDFSFSKVFISRSAYSSSIRNLLCSITLSSSVRRNKTGRSNLK